MDIEKTLTVAAPAARVWDMLLDPQIMAACVPGMQSVEVLSPTEYKALILVKIAFISARFKLRTTIVEQRAPSYLRTEGTGEDSSVASALKQTSELFLTDLGDGRTELRTRVVVDVTGRLGTFGLSAMKTKADRMWSEFCVNLVARIDADGPESADAVVVESDVSAALRARIPVQTIASQVGAPASGPLHTTPRPEPVAPQDSAPTPQRPADPEPATTAKVFGSEPGRNWWTRTLARLTAQPDAAAANGQPGSDHIRVQVQRDGLRITVDWPVHASAACTAWLRELTRS